MSHVVQSTASVHINAVIFIEALDESEWHTGTWLQGDLAALFDTQKVHHELHTIQNKGELVDLIGDLKNRVLDGLRPIIHIDAHGTADESGMHILPSAERILWGELADMLRQVNRASLNNLVVMMAMCSGYQAIRAVHVGDLSPFFQLIGPEHRVRNKAILTAFPRFYREMLTTGNLAAAADSIRGLGFKSFLAERVLVLGFIEYLLVQGRGRGRQRRMERMLTAIKARSPDRSPSEIRVELRQALRVENQDLERFKRRFLMSDHPANAGRFTIGVEDCLPFLEQVDAKTIEAYRARHDEQRDEG